ncbi:glycoside hydrolase family 3 protein [Amycolatopsis rhizosphaerae]|uniref:beta-N-acetylhexosaminidase n=1 Tax=Amycolatopsis rhizosphaerae TaxID=2053003 RepID=A0A557ZZL3_9PSEU|nr:glycoside hydrolase family 3 protein [Amycolatopsis rhizosphaerae]TVT17453.1 glycoside hydrolase family 3 protein [Amycolatopsis rhizosphaerae]
MTGVTAASTATAAPDGSGSGAAAWARQTLRGMSLEQKVGQLFIADVWGKSADEANPKNREKYGVDTPAQVVARYQPGGVIYFNNASTDNVDDPAQVARLSNGLQRAALTSGAHLPLIISTDQEGGRVTRIGSPATEYPASMAIGAGRSTADARRLASVNGHELRAMGITQDFAPDADVNSNPLNPIIGSRSFSADPALTSAMVTAEVDGYQNSGPALGTVSAAAKHFPGHGDAATDSHTGLPLINRTEQQWRAIDLPPFRAAIDAGIDVIMTAHITVPSLDPSGEPATLSKPIMTGILRDELHYDGVVVTDSLQMAGVRQMHPDAEIPVLALEAGVDQMLMPPNLGVAINGVLDAVKSGRLTEQRIDQSVLRILALKFKRQIIARPLVNEQAVGRIVGTPAHLAQLQAITDRTTTVLRNDAGLLPLKHPGKVLVTGWNNPNFPGYPAEPVATLAEQLGGTALSTGASPTSAQIDEAVAAAEQADTVVVLTNGLRTSTAQRSLVNGLLATGKPVVAVSVQEPYDPGYANSPTWVATYDWRSVTMRSLAKVLQGRVSPQGKLPVSIPSGSDPAGILYPFGTGLSW